MAENAITEACSGFNGTDQQLEHVSNKMSALHGKTCKTFFFFFLPFAN